MTDPFDLVTRAVRRQIRLGRTQVDLAAELNLPLPTLNALIMGHRRLGRKTFTAILAADPDWLPIHITGRPD